MGAGTVTVVVDGGMVRVVVDHDVDAGRVRVDAGNVTGGRVTVETVGEGCGVGVPGDGVAVTVWVVVTTTGWDG